MGTADLAWREEHAPTGSPSPSACMHAARPKHYLIETKDETTTPGGSLTESEGPQGREGSHWWQPFRRDWIACPCVGSHYDWHCHGDYPNGEKVENPEQIFEYRECRGCKAPKERPKNPEYDDCGSRGLC